MKRLFFFFVLIPLFLGLSQKVQAQIECAVDIYVQNECGIASLSVVGCPTCSYKWRLCNDTTTLTTNQTFFTNMSGCYVAEVTGNNTGCFTALGYYLEISEPCDTVPVDTVECCTNCDVSLDIAYGCGEATLTMIIDSFDNSCNYLYEWFTGEKTQSLKVFSSGSYKYRVSTENCSSGWKTVNVQIPPNPTVWISGKNQVCSGSTTLLTGLANIPINSYKWSNGATTSSINAGKGTWRVTVTDSNGCEAIATKTITEYPVPTVTISGKTEVCKNYTTELTASSSSCGSCFRWSTGETTKTIKVGKGTYTVTVTDPVTCCTATATITVTEVIVAIPDVYATIRDEEIILSSFGSYKSKWSTGEIGQTITADSSGVYTVQGIDENGCLSDTSCPIPVFIQKCEDDSVGTGGITLDTVICDTMIIRDTITVRDTLYYEDLIGGCFHGGLVSNPKIEDGSTIGVINNQKVKLYAPSNAEALYIDSYGNKIFLWNEVPSTSKVIEIETLREGTYFYRLKCKIQGKEVCLEFGYTIKKGGTTPSTELETRDEPNVWPNPTPGVFYIDLSNEPNGMYPIYNMRGQLIKKIIKQ